MPDCTFCKIAKKEIPAEVVYEDDDFVAFLDIKPVSTGHTLLIPKAHYENLVSAPDDLLMKSVVLIKKLMKQIKIAVRADFVVLSVVGVDVPHLHFHLIPRHNDDGLTSFWPEKETSKEELSRTAGQIRKFIK